MKLARSGRRIEDPEDATLVRSWIEYLEMFHTSWAGKFGFRVGPWIVVPLLVGSLVLGAVETNWLQLSVALIALVGYVLSLLRIRSWRGSMHRTALINGWLEDVEQPA